MKKTSTQTSPYNCDQCGKTYKTHYSLTIHYKGQHSHDFKHVCPLCSKGYTQTKPFRAHMSSHNKLAWSKCLNCNKEFMGHSSLSRHKQTCGKEVAAGRFVCEVCAITFKSRQNLQAHNRGKHRDPLYQCDSCGKSFA